MSAYEIFVSAMFFVACGLFAIVIYDSVCSIMYGYRAQSRWMPFIQIAATVVIFGLAFA